jgi:hypothetical protein
VLLEIRFRSIGTIDAFDAAALSKVNVDQFFGIEKEEFPARIAEVAMWMTDHIMNVRLSAAFGQSYLRIPLKTSPNIRHADALDVGWSDVLPPEKCSFVLGNPPYHGSKEQSELQRKQVRSLAALGGSGGTLDYVCAWFIKAGEYLQRANARIAFVSTNSITQGEQVAQLWPLLFDRYKLEIAFAHRTFEWLSDARGRAHVHCVIVGLTRRDDEVKQKRLFSYDDIAGDPVESVHAALSPYLFDASALGNRHLVVEETSQPLSARKKLISGSQPIDNGNYILDVEQRAEFLALEPNASKFLRPYVGSEEYINGSKRWILSLQNARPDELRILPHVIERMQAVRVFRQQSKRKNTVKIAEEPTRYNVEVIPTAPFLTVPEVSSERREYVPIGWLEPPTIPSNLVRILPGADLVDFGLITSRMHMAWLRNIGGRLKSDYRYSIGIVYNPFPWPEVDGRAREKIRALGEAVLIARTNHPESTLADLYDPNTMPPDLRRAHTALNVAVDRLYRKESFASDRERVEHLFKLYENLTAPMLAAASAKPKRGRTTKPAARTPKGESKRQVKGA